MKGTLRLEGPTGREGDSSLQRIGTYQILSYLGGGGMGSVYVARHESLGREVAVKVLRRDLLEDSNLAARFQREARLMAQIDHPNIVRVLDAGVSDGRHYLVMERIRGVSAGKLVGERGPLSLGETLSIVRGTLQGVREIHRIGIVHRDIKPENILIDEKGIAKLADFGLAHSVAQSTMLTQTGAIMGTPNYMAPEQWDGEKIDGRSDIYALGVTWYYLLTGSHPFEAAGPYGVLAKMTKGQRTPLAGRRSDLDPRYIQIVEQMCALDRENRYSGTEAILGALEALEIAGERTSPIQSPARTRRRRFRLHPYFFLGTMAAAAALIVPVVFLGSDSPPEDPAKGAETARQGAPVPPEPDRIVVEITRSVGDVIQAPEITIEGTVRSSRPVSRLLVGGIEAEALEPGWGRWRSRLQVRETQFYRVVAEVELEGGGLGETVLFEGPVDFSGPILEEIELVGATRNGENAWVVPESAVEIRGLASDLTGVLEIWVNGERAVQDEPGWARWHARLDLPAGRSTITLKAQDVPRNPPTKVLLDVECTPDAGGGGNG